MKKTLVLLFFFTLIFTLSARTVLASQTYSVEVESFLDDTNRNINVPAITGKARGEKVSFSTAGIGEQYSFAFYAVNGIVRDDLPSNYQFTVRANMKITAIYHPNGSLNPMDQRYVVVFADSNGNILSVKYVEAGTTVSDLDVTLPDKPNAVVATPKWSTADGLTTSLENISSNRVYFLQYEVDSGVTSVTLTANNASGSGTYGFNQVATLVAQNDLEGVPFSHFEDAEGNLLSTKQTYKFTMVKDTTVNAIYASTPEFIAPLVNMTDTLNIRSDHTSYIGQFELASGYELVEYGFIISRSSDVLTLESLGATVVPSNVHNGQTGEFLRSFPTDSYNSIRAYLIVSNTNGEETVQEEYYSENMTGNPAMSEQVIYQTGFETSEGFTTATNYQSTKVDNNWGFYFGTASTSDVISGTSSAQMRYYTSGGNENNFGYIRTEFDVSNVTKVEFDATSNNNNRVTASYSLDGGNTWIGNQLFDLSIGSNPRIFNINQTGNVRVKFTLTIPETAVTGSKLTIDNVKFFGNTSAAIHEVVYDNEGVISDEMIANNGLVTYTVSKTGYTFNGWYLDEAKTTAYLGGPVTQSLKLYAKYTINTYTVYFNYNGADGGELTPSIAANYDTEIVLPVPTKTGYDFAGWESSTGLTQYTSPFTIGSSNNNMYAKWTINDLGRTMEDAAALSLPTTISEATTLTLPLSGTNGSTISWATSNSSIITTGGVVTLPAETTEVTLTATISLNGQTTVREFAINVAGESSGPIAESFLETFDNITISGSSYITGSHVGVNSQSWNYTLSRGDQTLTGKALTTQTGVISTTFADGLSSISFDYVRAFTGTKSRSFEVWINGTLIDTIVVSPTSDSVSNYSNSGLNYSGSVLLEIKGSGTQKKIDNIGWTTNP